MSNIGFGGMVIILVVALLLFGPSKLPELGQAMGKTLRSFREALSGTSSDEKEEEKKEEKKEEPTAKP